MKLSKVLIILGMFLSLGALLNAKDIYVAQNAAGANSGADCANAHPASWFNTAANWGTGSTQIGPGTIVHLCGTFTFSANTTGLTVQGSGASGSPITVLFEPGAILQAPYFASSVGAVAAGAISLGSGRSYIVIDGGSNGIVRNTANGSSLANQKASTAIAGFSCTYCTVQNLNINDMYVNVQGNGTLGDNSIVRAIDFTGTHWVVANNHIKNCGWCIVDFYTNGTSDHQIYGNEVSNFGHGIAVATSGTGASLSNVYIHDNSLHDGANWDASGCPFHQDGLHIFGVSGSTINNFYFYNNYLWGDWGTCPTGFVYEEGGGVTNQYWWNNVFIVNATTIENTNGWVGIFGNASGGVTEIVNNTFIGNTPSNNSVCLALKGHPNLIVQNNVTSSCGDPIQIEGSTINSVDYNFYGTYNGSNAFIWNGSFKGTLSNWRAACSCDSHSIQSNSPALNANGSLQSTSPAKGLATNLTSAAVGYLATLSSDTTLGGTRSSSLRVASGSWDAGAYNVNSSVQAPNPPTGLTAAVQ